MTLTLLDNVDREIERHFVKENFRSGQKEAIKFALESYSKGKKIVIIEAPTGSGKTAIGMTLANFFNNSFYITSSKQLQDQIVGEFSKTITDLKGRNAYPCTFYQVHSSRIEGNIIPKEDLLKIIEAKPSCTNGFCKTKYCGSGLKNKPSSNYCTMCFTKEPSVIDNSITTLKGSLHRLKKGKYSDCPYYDQVYKAVEAKNTLMNFSSFLYQTTMSNRFSPRDFMIVDECHNIESQLMDFISFSLNSKMFEKYNMEMPVFDNARDYFEWINDESIEKVIFAELQEATDKNDTKQEDELSSLLRKIQSFKDNINSNIEWVVQTTLTDAILIATFKPVYVRKHVYPLIFDMASHILLMSATVLDVNVLCNSLGITKDDIAYYRMESNFPVSKRPIYIQPAAKMTGGKGAMKTWAPKMMEAIEFICAKYPDKKGILHTHNFAIHDWIIENSSKSLKKRLLSQKNYRDKAELLEHHATTENSVIVAPAMHEGVDLKDDLSRFQIICKVPYPNCFDDIQLKRRTELDRNFYNWLVALKTCQSYGRSIRSETDWADTYIIDESIYSFLDVADTMLPKWFKEAIIC